MHIEAPIRFHWSVRAHPELGSESGFLALCRCAEDAGIESVDVPVRGPLSEALELVRVSGAEAKRLNFRIAADFRAILQSLRGTDLKSLHVALEGRLILHIVFGNDDLAAASEFVVNCRRLFEPSSALQVHVEGDSAEAAVLAIKHGDCLWRLPGRPRQVYADALPVLHFGKEVGLTACVIAQEFRDDAVRQARELFPHSTTNGQTLVLAGACDEVADTIHEYKENGITQFLVSSVSGVPELETFAHRVIPKIRAIESDRSRKAASCESC